MVRIGKMFEFDSAHLLPNHEGKCKSLHGHRYNLFVMVSGEIDSDSHSPSYGMVMDFSKFKIIFEELNLDHKFLNEIFSYPTAENMVVSIAKRIRELLSDTITLEKVVLWETPTSCAEWIRGEK